MLVPVTSSKIYDWLPNQQVYVYSADKKCLELCRVIDLNLCTGDGATRPASYGHDLLNLLMKICNFASHKKEFYRRIASELGSVPIPKPVIDSKHINRIMNAHFHLRKIMQPTDDMKVILDFLKQFGVGSIPEISFCTQIEEWRVEIDLQDIADEGWVTLSTDREGHTVAIIKP